MSKHLFGWSYPPGVSKLPWDDVPDPSPESEEVCELLEKLRGISRKDDGEIAKDKVVEVVDRLAQERDRLKELLQSTLRYLPERGEPPPCTCTKGDNQIYGPIGPQWCERHNGIWDEPTLKEEIEYEFKTLEEIEGEKK
jgi:hypothetical protein